MSYEIRRYRARPGRREEWVRTARRAKEAGRLRPDFLVPDDLVLLLTANQGIRAATAADRVAASRRFAGFVVQAIQATQAIRATARHSPPRGDRP